MDDTQKPLADALEVISTASDLKGLEALRVHYLGKKGVVTEQLKALGQLPVEERKVQGQRVNILKEKITQALESRQAILQNEALRLQLEKERIDVSLPGRGLDMGSIHPISKTRTKIEIFFRQMGFEVATGPHIETDYYNFEALNIPKHHPARAMQDTFYFEDGSVLRTHTSSVQARYLESHKPPFRMIAPGRVYRCDSDVTHTPMFHQVEGLVIDKNITMAHLKTLLQDFLQNFFESDCQLRFRSSYFPFTEPSAEVDVSCVICKGTKTGCRVCKETGWLEVLGCGMVHPNALKMSGIDAEEYTGFAFGMGLERLTMIRYQVSDLRQFFENDVRFLTQFTGA